MQSTTLQCEDRIAAATLQRHERLGADGGGKSGDIFMLGDTDDERNRCALQATRWGKAQPIFLSFLS